MVDYANGRAPESALVHGDGIHLAPDVAVRFNAFQRWAAGQGVELHVARPYGGYRDTAEQKALYAQGGNSGLGLPVAKPGTSTHGNLVQGRVDIVGPGNVYSKSLLQWIVAHAGSFGLIREFGDRDPNHFMAYGTYDLGSTKPAGGGSTPITSTPSNGDDDMYDKAARDELITRVDTLTQLVVNLTNFIGPVLAREDAANAKFISSFVLYRQTSTGAIANVNERAGIFRSYASMDALAADRNAGIATQAPAVELTDAQWADLAKRTAANAAK